MCVYAVYASVSPPCVCWVSWERNLVVVPVGGGCAVAFRILEFTGILICCIAAENLETDHTDAVKAFTQADVDHLIYVEMPEAFGDERYVLLLYKALEGIKQGSERSRNTSSRRCAGSSAPPSRTAGSTPRTRSTPACTTRPSSRPCSASSTRPTSSATTG